jgi:adenosylmethionine-8-amino-7-oxononanoate aminotransferase
LVALGGAFHGETVGATSLGGIDVFKRPFAGILFDCIRVPSPADPGAYDRAFEDLTRAVGAASDRIAAVVIEPILQGASGMRIYDPAFLRHARSLCNAHEIPLVFDEVFTGYGRTGPMWACDHAGVAPDILCVGKAFSGGMLPMAATLTTERVFRGFFGDRSRALCYGHTYCGNPLGAAVAREVLKIYADEDVIGQAEKKAAVIERAFAALGDVAGVKLPRAIGMVGAVDLEGDDGYLADCGRRVQEAARRRGVYLRPLGNVVYVCPPLTISEADLDDLLGKVAESLREAARG